MILTICFGAEKNAVIKPMHLRIIDVPVVNAFQLHPEMDLMTKIFNNKELITQSPLQNKNKNIKRYEFRSLMTTVVLAILSYSIFSAADPFQPAFTQSAIQNTTATDANGITSLSANETRALGTIIPNEWIVTLKENATMLPQQAESSIAALSDTIENAGVQVTAALPEVGVLVLRTPPNQVSGDEVGVLADIEETDPNVLTIEPNRVQGIFEQSIPTGIERIDAEPDTTVGATNSTSPPANGNMSTPDNKTQSTGNVTSVIAVIDTGIDLDNPDLNVITDVSFVPGVTSGDDDHGHGTHVAGTVAAKDNAEGVVGVAPGANLVAVKVLDADGFGSTASVLAGIDYVIANANETDVANLSLGGGFSVAENTAIRRAVEKGVTMVVAAGNEHIDASSVSPASAPEAITVSAIADSDGKCGGLGAPLGSMKDDSFASFSNYGEVVDIAAPGVRINSTVPDGGFNAFSGTSMASPHVAGTAALYKSANPNATPDQVEAALLSIASDSATNCDLKANNGKGYIVDRSMDWDDEAEPLLYAKGLGNTS